MLFRTQIIFCSSELRLHFRIAEVGSLLSLNRAWRAQVTIRTVKLSQQATIQMSSEETETVMEAECSLLPETRLVCRK